MMPPPAASALLHVTAYVPYSLRKASSRRAARATNTPLGATPLAPHIAAAVAMAPDAPTSADPAAETSGCESSAEAAIDAALAIQLPAV